MEFKVLCTILSDDAVVAPAGPGKARYGNTSKTNYSARKILLRMKLVILLTAVACLQAWSIGHTQSITISLKEASLEKVFKEIRKQTQYTFIYTKEELTGTLPVTLEVKEAAIEQVLEICFRQQPLTYVIEDNHIVVKKKKEPPIVNQPGLSHIDIKGRVLNEKAQPVEGVSVRIKGTNIGTSTDLNGVFELKNVDENAVLVFSGVNVESYEIKVNGKTDWTISLKTKIVEDEGVTLKMSTGYQELQKERATGSFTQVDNSTLNQQAGSNILNRLDGVASGVLFAKQQLQNGPNFMVRGLSTINGPKNPLIVLDNFPYDGDINNINPNDIESVTILKDAAAASIWGVRAGNGVVVITTKKGRFNQPLKVELNSSIIITGKPDFSSLRTISSSDYIDVETFLFGKGYYNSFLNNTFSRPSVSPVVGILADRRAGLVSPGDSASQINAYRNVDIRDQYKKYLYQQAVTQQYAVNLSGGSANIAYYLSAGYDKNSDLLNNTNDRLTIRSENICRPLKNLQLALGVQYTQVKSGSGKPGYGSILVNQQWQIPYLQFADANGNPLAVAKNYRDSYTDTAGAGKLLNWKYYPLEDYKHNTSEVDQQDLLANIGFTYQIIRELSVDVKYLYERQSAENRGLQDLQSFDARDMINLFSQLNRTTGIVTYKVPVGGILNLSNNVLQSQNFRGQLNYIQKWNKSSVVALAGAEVRQTHITGNSNKVYGYNDNTLVLSNVDFVNTYPTFINGNFSNIPGGVSLTGKLNRFVSVFGNSAYTFNNKYTFLLSGRRDASNLFGVNTNNKWNLLWSAGGAWEISRESFYKINWLPYLKFRTTYGFSGNTDPSRTGVVTLVLNDPLPPANLPSSRVNQFPNPDLRWEKVQMINIGLDFQSKEKELSGSVEGYFKKGIDLYGAAPVDPTAGLNGQSSLVKNIANMEGKGMDITINSKNLEKELKWYTTLFFSYNVNKTTAYRVDSNLRSGNFISNGSLINPLVGKPLYSIIGFRWAGLDQGGNPRGYYNKQISTDYANITQNTRKEDLVYKPALPVFFGNLINNFNWKGFGLSVNVSCRLGYYFLKPAISYANLYGGGAYIGSSEYAKRWQNPGDEKITNIPSMVYPANNSRDILYNFAEINILKADNIKLQYLNLSYDFDNKIMKKLPLRRLQLNVNVGNLGILWKANKAGIDPDYTGSVPTPRKTYALGFKADF